MYTLDKIENQFKGICAKAGVSCNVPITINSRLTRTLGRVVIKNSIGATNTWKPIKVEFSKQFIETSSDASIEDVIKHEAAHFIATSRTGKDCVHNVYFKSICAEIGTTNDGITTKVERTVDESYLYKYAIYCDTCNKVIGGKSRMCRTIKEIKFCTCKTCNTSNLRVIQNW